MWMEILYILTIIIPILVYFVILYFAPISLEGGFGHTKINDDDPKQGDE